MKPIALLLVGFLYGCGHSDSQPQQCPVTHVDAQHSETQLENDLSVLVAHCWDFDQIQRGDVGYCGILIPQTDATDNAISGKLYFTDRFNPPIPSDEGYLVINHVPCHSPFLVINGSVISGNYQNCETDAACLSGVVSQIQSIDARSNNTLFADTVRFYADAVQRRYDNGVKRESAVK